MPTSPTVDADATELGQPSSKKKKRKAANVSAARFSCPQCQRSFGRVEHLKRHLGSHTEDRPFKCRTCSKAFLRSDTLQRHEVIHDDGHNQTKPKGSRACFECAGAKVKCNNCLPCARCSAKALDCKYPADAVAATVAAAAPIVGGREQDPFRVQLPTADVAIASSLAVPSASPGKAERVLPSISSITGSGSVQTQAASPWDQSFTNLNWLSTGLTPSEGLARTGLTPNAGGSSPGDAALATQHQHQQQHSLASDYNDTTVHPDEMSNGIHRRWLDTVTQSSPMQRDQVGNPDASQGQPGTNQYYADGTGAGIPDTGLKGIDRLSSSGFGATVPNTAAGYQALRGFLPAEIQPREATKLPTSGETLMNAATYQQMQGVFEQLCVTGDLPLFRPFESHFFPSIEDFRIFIRLYIEHAHDVLPVLHLPTLDLTACHWTLALAMAAIGSQFYEGEVAVRDSYAMQEMLHRAFLMLEETKYKALDEIDTCIARLLHCVGMAYSGDMTFMNRALRLHHKLAEQCINAWQSAEPELGPPDKDDQEVHGGAWRLWIEQEQRSRLGYAIWMLDCMMRYHHQRRPVLRLEDASSPLPCPEILWEATSAAQWRQGMEYPVASPPLTSALQTIFAEKKFQSSLGEFSRVLIIHGLYRRTWEICSYFEQPLTYWTPKAERQKVSQVLPDDPGLHAIPAYDKWRNVICDSLDILHWAANSAIGAAAGVEHPTVAHLHLSRVVLLTPARAILRFATAVTAIETIDPAQIASIRAEIRKWTLQDQQKARLAMVHAGVQFWHLRKFSVGGFYEPHAILLSALALWAFGTFTENDHTSPHLPQASSAEEENALPPSINLDRLADDELVQTFVRRGSQMTAMMSGIGNVCAAEGPQKVLSEGVKLLSSMPYWGSVRQAAHLLRALSSVPREVVQAADG